jgi:endonuclease/exonuclease/phosphatase family metal-dependent hydrolase
MPRRLIIASYNIRTSIIDEAEASDELQNWNHRKGEVFKIIRKQDPDIFGVQEDSPEQLRDLQQEFQKDYNVIYHEDSLTKYNPEYNALFIKKNHEVFDTGYYWISETPEMESKIDGSKDIRHLNYARIKIYEEDYLFINLHLDDFEDYSFKKKEAKYLLKILKDKFRENLEQNLVMLGDFNFRADDSPSYKELETVFVNVSKEKGVREPTLNNWNIRNFYYQADFFWVSQNLKDRILNFEIVKDKYTRTDGTMMEPSDHFLIKFSLKPLKG